MKFFWLKIGCWFAFGFGWYYRWSKLYRWLFEQRFKNIATAKYDNMGQLNSRMKKFPWRKDGIKQLFDAVSYPGRVELCFASVAYQKTGGNDCDEAAIYCMHVLSDWPEITLSYFMSVVSTNGAHNVCAFKTSGSWHNISNWSEVNSRGPFINLDAMARNIAGTMGGELIAYSLADKNLNKIHWRHF